MVWSNYEGLGIAATDLRSMCLQQLDVLFSLHLSLNASTRWATPQANERRKVRDFTTRCQCQADTSETVRIDLHIEQMRLERRSLGYDLIFVLVDLGPDEKPIDRRGNRLMQSLRSLLRDHYVVGLLDLVSCCL